MQRGDICLNWFHNLERALAVAPPSRRHLDFMPARRRRYFMHPMEKKVMKPIFVKLPEKTSRVDLYARLEADKEKP
jgi:hypothetical protein